ncbi:MAG: hypothetical protein RID15_09160 [Marinovum algicola]|uniref:hypothetical protein n=1 Tax=Marinovum algicola TaxID=42444 RepID=UPI0032EBE849
MIRAAIAALLLMLPLTARAAEPEIVKIQVSKPDMGWLFEVTLRHADTGWDHYADGWEVLDRHGNRLGFRRLTHPHVNEQPFTRSLRGVMIPDGIRMVMIRVHCTEDGWSSRPIKVKLSPAGRGTY